MPKYTISERDNEFIISSDNYDIIRINKIDGAHDSFSEIEEGVWHWTRTTDTPVDEMRMEFDTCFVPEYTMIPALNYNGNGWGDSVEYTGDNCDGMPWTYAFHRTTIPSCTYTEGKKFAAALMAEADDETSCSLWRPEGADFERHALIWPEQEGPKVLYRHVWHTTDFMGSMEPRCEFKAIIMTFPVIRARHQCRNLLDFAWRYYGHEMSCEYTPAQMWKLSIAFMKTLWTVEKDGFVAFNRGLQWYKSQTFFGKRDNVKYEIGWVGQSASASNALIANYLRTGDEDSLEKAEMCLDAWCKFSKFEGSEMGLRYIKFDGAPVDQQRDIPFDACNLGQGAFQMFEAYDLMQKCGKEKPAYLEYAYDVCRFALTHQLETGEYAKSWNRDGSVNQQNGTIGAFLIPAMLEAYKRTGKEEYLESAKKAFDCYYKELADYGFTTAGALDTYCIDKESASPLLTAAIALYDVVGEKKYVDCAEDIAWYLSTWMMHYTVKYPQTTSLGKIGYDSLGQTAVSTAHNAIDQYALKDVLSFLRLGEITGYKQWKERGLAFFYGASQLISDGTLCISGRVRPAGSQDEAIFHTRWGRPGLAPFNPSQWLVMWPCAFRMEILRYADSWDVFDEGIKEIEGAIKK